VVDGVAGSAPEAEELGLGLVPVADAGEVLVAVLVDLAAAHHHVATPVPQHREHLRVRVPRLDDLVQHESAVLGAVRVDARGDHRRREHAEAVGHHQVRLEGLPGEASADHRDGADRVAEPFAITAEALGHRDHADLVPRRVAHRAPFSARRAATACW
jgi:hypothetical protein